MGQLQKPAYYKCPLKSRADIIGFLLEKTSQRYYHGHHPLCFNVKLHKLNLDFQHLMQVWRKAYPTSTWTKAAVLAARRFYLQNRQYLWEWAVEDAQRAFVSDMRNAGGAPDADTFQMTWDGTRFDVRYSFQGRGGGWLSIDRFQHTDLTTGDIEDTLAEMNFKDLRRLYQLVVMLLHDLKHPEQEVEHQAAFAVFNRIE